jgi:hypothetical protein
LLSCAPEKLGKKFPVKRVKKIWGCPGLPLESAPVETSIEIWRHLRESGGHEDSEFT